MIFSRLLIVFLLLLAQSFSLQSAERHAFVVGNSNYGDAQQGSLVNPRKDATDMAAALKDLGYRIYGGKAQLDLDNETFGNALQNFAIQLPHNAIALFYFAGHGISYNGDNYLIPVEAQLEFQGQLGDRAVSLSSIVDLLKNRPGDPFNIVLLDACRNNPLKTRGFQKGLRNLGDLPRGTFIGYAAAPGETAADGNSGGNGIYTGELLKALKTSSDLPIESVHKEVAANVFKLTDGSQQPGYESQLIGKYCFAACLEIAPPQPAIIDPAPAPLRPPPEEPAHSKNQFNPWLAILGAVVVGALLSAAGGSDNEGTEAPFTIQLNPPTE